MEYIELNKESQLDEIREKSGTSPQLIFKYSSRCSLSDTIRQRLDQEPNPPNMTCYFLDLIRYRRISNRLAEEFVIRHESPQVLVIRNGECVYHESHFNINIEEIISAGLEKNGKI
jgi:bacillithiol system protein YtxJ